MSRIFEEIVRKRGLTADFLNPKYLSQPEIFQKMPDMARAVELILATISRQEKILVYGDYDVERGDGNDLDGRSTKIGGGKRGGDDVARPVY